MLIGARNTMFRASSTATARDYVQSGLVAMWDGIENAGWGQHDSNATTWTDVVGGHDGTLYPSGVSWTSDSLLISGDCKPCMVPSSIGSILHTKKFTIEISNKSSYRDRRGTLFGNYNADNHNGFNIEWRYNNGIDYTYRAYFNGNPDVATPGLYELNVRQTTTLSLDENDLRLYHDGTVFYSTASWTITAPGITQFCLGGEINRSSLASLGNLYCVRLYSRALTAEEIAANYAIDAARFNLPQAS